MRVLLIWMALASLVLFIMMGSDKLRAKQHRRRISEAGLFLPALLGGAIGGTLGMYTFRHKTKHWYFKLFFPLLAALQIAVPIYFLL